MSLSDLRAVQNLTSSEISNIASQSLTYGGMTKELYNQINLVTTKRTGISEAIGNIAKNAQFGIGKEMYSSPVMYAMMKMVETLDALGVDIPISFVEYFGTGFDLNTSVNNLLKMGIGLAGATSMISKIFSGLGGLGGAFTAGLSPEAWGGTEYNVRGSLSPFELLGSLIGGTSGSAAYTGSGSSEDIISGATEEAKTTSGFEEDPDLQQKQKEVQLGLHEIVWARTKAIPADANITQVSLSALPVAVVEENKISLAEEIASRLRAQLTELYNNNSKQLSSKDVESAIASAVYTVLQAVSNDNKFISDLLSNIDGNNGLAIRPSSSTQALAPGGLALPVAVVSQSVNYMGGPYVV